MILTELVVDSRRLSETTTVFLAGLRDFITGIGKWEAKIPIILEKPRLYSQVRV